MRHESHTHTYVKPPRLLIALIVLLMTGSKSFALTCTDLFGNKSDAEAKRELYTDLHKAMKDDYSVEVMKTVINGKEKTLVILGETHIKSPTSAAIGQDVVNHFDVVGNEGYDSNKTWGGKFKNSVMAPVLAKIGIKGAPQFWMARLISRFKGPAGRTEGSSTRVAAVAEMKNKYSADLKEMPRDKLAEMIRQLEEAPAEIRRDAIQIDGIKIFTFDEILSMAKEAYEGRELETFAGPKKTIHLEDGHKPDIWENIDSIQNYITVGILAGYYATSFLIPQHLADMIGWGVNSFSVYELVGLKVTSSKFQTSTWASRLFPLSLAILRGRNATMINNIDKVFNEQPDVNEMLVIVGKLHVPEMKLLLQRNNYQSIPLPEPEQMATQDVLDEAHIP